MGSHHFHDHGSYGYEIAWINLHGSYAANLQELEPMQLIRLRLFRFNMLFIVKHPLKGPGNQSIL